MKDTGICDHTEIKALFRRQWVNGDLVKFMASVKRRTKAMYGIDLVFSNQDEFLNELIRYKLIDLKEKGGS